MLTQQACHIIMKDEENKPQDYTSQITINYAYESMKGRMFAMVIIRSTYT